MKFGEKIDMEEVKKAVEVLKNMDYKTLFAALLCYERPDDYMNDQEKLEKLYDFYMDFDYYTGLFNIDELEDLFEEYGDYDDDDEDEDEEEE